MIPSRWRPTRCARLRRRIAKLHTYRQTRGRLSSYERWLSLRWGGFFLCDSVVIDQRPNLGDHWTTLGLVNKQSGNKRERLPKSSFTILKPHWLWNKIKLELLDDYLYRFLQVTQWSVRRISVQGVAVRFPKDPQICFDPSSEEYQGDSELI